MGQVMDKIIHGGHGAAFFDLFSVDVLWVHAECHVLGQGGIIDIGGLGYISRKEWGRTGISVCY